jgi:hypothetical protein
MTYKINTVFPNTKKSEIVYDNNMWKNMSCAVHLHNNYLVKCNDHTRNR